MALYEDHVTLIKCQIDYEKKVILDEMLESLKDQHRIITKIATSLKLLAMT